ncbi:MAG TPA: PP0621 family protein [Burkholderiaceae bacterium]|nr:PP0621 family protein [Burkholderiaceae bacterium]
MGKILFWFVVIVVVLFGARLLARSSSKDSAGTAPTRRVDTKPDMSEAESMVRCQHCGIHLPRSEAFLSNGKTWCGPEHARIGSRPSDSA